jgi:hypothetical protein
MRSLFSPAGIAFLTWTLVPAILVFTRPELVGLGQEATACESELSSRLATIESRLEELTAQDRRQPSLQTAPPAAVRAPVAPPSPTAPEAASAIPAAPAKAQEQREFEALLESFLREDLDAEGQERFWALARGKIDLGLWLRGLEAEVEQDPADTARRMRLARGYVARLLTLPGGPEQGYWGKKAEAQWESVLESDEQHWEARFNLATNFSYYPLASNKGPDAIKHFQFLRTLQEAGVPEARQAQVYLRLSMLHRQQGNHTKARSVLAVGRMRHPEDADLRKAQEAMED